MVALVCENRGLSCGFPLPAQLVSRVYVLIQHIHNLRYLHFAMRTNTPSSLYMLSCLSPTFDSSPTLLSVSFTYSGRFSHSKNTRCRFHSRLCGMSSRSNASSTRHSATLASVYARFFPMQFRFPYENGWNTAQLSRSYRAGRGSKKRSGTKSHGSVKLDSRW